MSGRGRPRAFDPEAVLRQAMWMFWERGYEATSLADLTAETGVNSPSLYACFGSKEELFRAAIDLYLRTESGTDITELFALPTARASIEAVLRERVIAFSESGKPHGCMMVLSGTNTTHPGVRDFLAETRRGDIAAMADRIDRGIADGDLPPGTDAKSLATYCTTVLHGLSIQARDGAGRAEMLAVVDAAMLGWDAIAARPTG